MAGLLLSRFTFLAFAPFALFGLFAIFLLFCRTGSRFFLFGSTGQAE